MLHKIKSKITVNNHNNKQVITWATVNVKVLI